MWAESSQPFSFLRKLASEVAATAKSSIGMEVLYVWTYVLAPLQNSVPGFAEALPVATTCSRLETTGGLLLPAQ